MSRRKIWERESPRHIDPITTIDIGCSDRRIAGSRGQSGVLTKCDMAIPITRPGGIKNLVYPKHPRDRECFFEDIEVFGNGITVIRVRAHNDCKACDECQDLDYYENMLIEGGRLLKARYPKVEVILIIVDFDGYYLVEEDEALVGAGAS